MQKDTLIDQGISLMLYGMGTVFMFLTILVFATGLMSKLVRLLSSTNEEPSIGDSPITAANNSLPDRDTLEAIKQAIALHRQR